MTLGRREEVPALIRAAVAVGVDALFLETHANPEHAKSDAGHSPSGAAEVERLLKPTIRACAGGVAGLCRRCANP